MTNVLRVFRITSTAKLPTKAHPEDACFDVYADFEGIEEIPSTHMSGKELLKPVDGKLILPPNSVTIIPTGICLGIPEGYRVDVNARSGRSTQGQGLMNGVGIVDAGYKDEIKVIMQNFNTSPVEILQGDKIAQIHLERVLETELLEVYSPLALGDTEDRQGGLGSTGR